MFSGRDSTRFPRTSRAVSRLMEIPENAPIAETGFRYPLNIAHLGWPEDVVPLKLQFYPFNVQPRMKQMYLVKNREYKIGRDSSCDIFFDDMDTIPELLGISGLHAKLKIVVVAQGNENHAYLSIKDVSTNGTYVNGEKCPKGVYVDLTPKCYVHLLKSKDEGVRPNVGFRVVLATTRPKFEDDYTLGPKLGEGTFGEVYEVTHMRTRQLFAAKILKPKALGSKEDRYCEREVGILRNISHENIVKFRESFEEFLVEGNVLKVKRTFVMEYVRGGSLSDYLHQRGGSVKETTAQHIIRQVVEALGYMIQYHQIVHRDLKPANILVSDYSETPKVKLADFGLAKVDNPNSENTFCGTEAFLPPGYRARYEATGVAQEVGMNWALDSYATGVITYKLLTGQYLNDETIISVRGTSADPLFRQGCSLMSHEFIIWSTKQLDRDRMVPWMAGNHPWLSGVPYEDYSFRESDTRFDQLLPPTQQFQSSCPSARSQHLPRPTAIRSANPVMERQPVPQLHARGPQAPQPAQRPSSSDSSTSDSSRFSRSSSPSSQSSDDGSTIRPALRAPPPSIVSDKMSICSQFVEEMVVGKDETTTKTSASACHSMMSVETQREGGKTWLILYPLKGNLKGQTMVSIEKETVQCGSNVSADLRFRDPKIKPVQATITRGPYDEKDGRTAYLRHPGSDTLVRFSHNETIFIYKDGKDYIGYKACFTEAVQVDSATTIVKDMTRLSMGPVRTHQEKRTSYFTPYSTAARFSQKSGSPLGATIRSAPNRPLKSNKLEASKRSDGPRSPWAKLVSKTEDRPNIFLFTDSTGIGTLVDFVDTSTGERGIESSCLIYRTDDGKPGIHAVKPVIIGGKCLYAAETLRLKHGQAFSLCQEDGSVLQEYEFQLCV